MERTEKEDLIKTITELTGAAINDIDSTWQEKIEISANIGMILIHTAMANVGVNAEELLNNIILNLRKTSDQFIK